MIDLLLTGITITFMNVAIHAAFWEGMVFGEARIMMANFLDQQLGLRWSKIVQKPLWDCLTCMSSIWTIVWILVFPSIHAQLQSGINLFQLILVVAGMSTVIDFTIFYLREP